MSACVVASLRDSLNDFGSRLNRMTNVIAVQQEMWPFHFAVLILINKHRMNLAKFRCQRPYLLPSETNMVWL